MGKIIDGRYVPDKPFGGRVPAATCATCDEPLARLSRVEWVDALDNKASEEPTWHEHHPSCTHCGESGHTLAHCRSAWG